ncbi:MAG: hypothetical protein ABIH25_02260 [Candidatus Woesearchaeota archaeon]
MDEEIRKKFEVIEKRISILEGSSKKEDIILQEKSPDEIFEEHDGKIVITKITGETPKEKAKNIVLLSLLGYKQKLGELDVHASKLRENVAIHQIPLENFGTWVKELSPRSVMKKGKRGSTKITYKLTTFGEAKAKNLLKEILANGKTE